MIQNVSCNSECYVICIPQYRVRHQNIIWPQPNCTFNMTIWITRHCFMYIPSKAVSPFWSLDPVMILPPQKIIVQAMQDKLQSIINGGLFYPSSILKFVCTSIINPPAKKTILKQSVLCLVPMALHHCMGILIKYSRLQRHIAHLLTHVDHLNMPLGFSYESRMQKIYQQGSIPNPISMIFCSFK